MGLSVCGRPTKPKITVPPLTGAGGGEAVTGVAVWAGVGVEDGSGADVGEGTGDGEGEGAGDGLSVTKAGGEAGGVGVSGIA